MRNQRPDGIYAAEGMSVQRVVREPERWEDGGLHPRMKRAVNKGDKIVAACGPGGSNSRRGYVRAGGAPVDAGRRSGT